MNNSIFGNYSIENCTYHAYIAYEYLKIDSINNNNFYRW